MGGGGGKVLKEGGDGCRVWLLQKEGRWVDCERGDVYGLIFFFSEGVCVLVRVGHCASI